MDIDKILTAIGGYGFFQKRNSLLLGTIIFVLTFQTLVMVFIGAEPGWKCRTGSVVCKLNGTISVGHDDYNKRCQMNRTDWEFTNEFTSIVTEWDLVCGDEALASLAQSVLFIGWIPGAFIIGRLSDMFGRRKVLFPAVAMAALIALASSFVKQLWLFLLLRGIIGFFEGGVYIVVYVLNTEFVGPAHRSLAGTIIWIFFTLSLITLDGMAYGIRNWRHLSIAVSAPAVPMVLFWWWVPESCRWHLVTNKPKEARKTLELIARLNGKEMPADVGITLDTSKDEKAATGGVLDLFRPKRQLLQNLILWFSWFTNSMVYYGVTLSAGVLGGSLYLNFLLATLVELPGNSFSIWLMNLGSQVICKKFYGRKRALILGLILAALFCTIVSAFPKTGHAAYQPIKITAAVLGKFFISISFCTIYVASTELLPTVIRNVGMGSMAVMDQFGASMAPFVVLLDKTHPVLPFSLMAGCALIAGFLCLTLPEPLGRKTLETLDDIERTRKMSGFEEDEADIQDTGL